MISIELKEILLIKLLQLFPNIDIGYLNKIIQNQIIISNNYSNSIIINTLSNQKGKGKEKDLNQNDKNQKELEKLIERITTKILEFNKGNFPISTFDGSKFKLSNNIMKKGESSKTVLLSNQEKSLENAKTMDRNLALIHLHQIFPNTPITTLRNLLFSLPHSFLFTAVDELLTNPTQSPPIPQRSSSYLSSFFSTYKPSTSTKTAVQAIPILLPSDLFRSEEYTEALIVHLKSLFPLVPLFTIKAVVADGGSYSEIRKSVENWRAKTSRVKVWLSDVFLNSTSISTSSSPNNKNINQLGEESELEKEIWDFEAPIRETKLKEDEFLARKLNLEWSKKESKYECGCCFDDTVEFLDVGFCSSGSHSFCKSCISRQVEEHVFGQAPLRILVEHKIEVGQGAEGEGIGVRCLSTEGCLSPFSHSTLERILSPTLFSALSRRLSESILESLQQFQQFNSSNDETLIRCPFCSYSEIGDGAVLTKAFPLLTSIKKKTLTLEGLFFYPLIDLFATFNLLYLYGIAYIIISCFPTSFSHLAGLTNSTTTTSSSKFQPQEDNPTFFPLLEPNRVILVIHRFLTLIGKEILLSKNGNRNTFQCKNGPNHLPLLPFGQILTSYDDSVPVVKDFNDLVKKVWPGWKESSVVTSSEKVTVGKQEGEEKKKLGVVGSGEIIVEREASRGGVQETCGRLSCLSCQKIYVDGRHICHEDEKEGLRLSIETAIDNVCKRKCSQCGLSYQKESGCNKIVCRCGYVSCYTCRMGIKEESYSHFCSHFRNILGASCTQCNLCSLWETPDDKIAIELATTRAKADWIREHPQTTREALNQKIGHNVKHDPFRYLSNYVEYFLRLLL